MDSFKYFMIPIILRKDLQYTHKACTHTCKIAPGQVSVNSILSILVSQAHCYHLHPENILILPFLRAIHQQHTRHYFLASSEAALCCCCNDMILLMIKWLITKCCNLQKPIITLDNNYT